ncbi:MAG: hypothetical protein K0R02_70 [Rickettsiaceae bacterium]|jgi:hypothetical protein|nr:hypothetical protein [Rickettsiaceae bacterium]
MVSHSLTNNNASLATAEGFAGAHFANGDTIQLSNSNKLIINKDANIEAVNLSSGLQSIVVGPNISSRIKSFELNNGGLSFKLENNSKLTIESSFTFKPSTTLSMGSDSKLVFLGDELIFNKGSNLTTDKIIITLNKEVAITNPDHLELHITPKHVANENEPSLSLSDLVHLNNLSKLAAKPNAPEVADQLKPLIGLNEEQEIKLSVYDIDNLHVAFSILDDVLNYHTEFALLMGEQESGL